MRVAMMQASPSDSVPYNMDRLEHALQDAAAGSADLLVTPEMFLTGYNVGAEACRALAQPIDGPQIARVSKMAAAAGVAVLVGFPELGDGDQVFNALALISASGSVISSYRKTHLFGDVDRSQFSAGASFPEPVEVGGAKVGLAICYDIEFPEVSRMLALAGADVVLVPTANWLDTVNNRVVPVRAQENGIAVVYVNFAGAEGDLEYCGQSVAAGPDGEFLAQAFSGESITFADIDPSTADKVRARIDYLTDRRPELY